MHTDQLNSIYTYGGYLTEKGTWITADEHFKNAKSPFDFEWYLQIEDTLSKKNTNIKKDTEISDPEKDKTIHSKSNDSGNIVKSGITGNIKDSYESDNISTTTLDNLSGTGSPSKVEIEDNKRETDLVSEIDTHLLGLTNVGNLKVYQNNLDEYDFYKRSDGKIEIKTKEGFDEITGLTTIQFKDKSLHVIDDIKATFDLVTGKDNVTGRMFRLYNAAFARFPDASGLEYWIGKNASGENSTRVVAESFLASEEFANKYGRNVSHETYVNNLYKNVLGRDADNDGFNYWLGNLNAGIDKRYEALLGFAESEENQIFFTEITGLY